MALALITLSAPAPLLIGFMTAPGLGVHSIAKAIFPHLAARKEILFSAAVFSSVVSSALSFVVLPSAWLAAAVAIVTFSCIAGYELLRPAPNNHLQMLETRLAALEGKKGATEEQMQQVLAKLEGLPNPEPLFKALETRIEAILCERALVTAAAAEASQALGQGTQLQIEALKAAISEMRGELAKGERLQALSSDLLEKLAALTGKVDQMQQAGKTITANHKALAEAIGGLASAESLCALEERFQGLVSKADYQQLVEKFAGLVKLSELERAFSNLPTAVAFQQLLGQVSQLTGMMMGQAFQRPAAQAQLFRQESLPELSARSVPPSFREAPLGPFSTPAPRAERPLSCPVTHPHQNMSSVSVRSSSSGGSACSSDESSLSVINMDLTLTDASSQRVLAALPETPAPRRTVVRELALDENKVRELVEAFKANNPLPQDKPKNPTPKNRALYELVFYEGTGAEDTEAYRRAISERPQELLSAKVVKLPGSNFGTEARLRYLSIIQDITLQEGKYTALSWPIIAAMGDQLKFIIWLKDQKADFNYIVNGRHAIHFAVSWGSADVTRWMLQNEEITSFGRAGALIPLLFDAACHPGDCLQHLLQDPRIESSTANRLVSHPILQAKEPLNWVPRDTKLNALHAAILREDEAHVGLLIRAPGIELNTSTEAAHPRKNGGTATPLHLLLRLIGERQDPTHWAVAAAEEIIPQLKKQDLLTPGTWFSGSSRNLLKEELTWNGLLKRCPQEVERRLKKAANSS